MTEQADTRMPASGSQKVWLITGTSSGLGREIALAALARNECVIVTARSLQKIVGLQEVNPERCRIMQLDVTDSFQVLQRKAQEAVSFWGRIDVLVNNAGYGHFGLVEEGGSEALQQIFSTNVFGAVNVSNAILPYMREQRNGIIVMIGSRSAWRTKLTGNAFYGSSKAALHAITDALAEEVKPFGIRVINAIPGGTGTDGVANALFTNQKDLLLSHKEDRYGEVPEYGALRDKFQTWMLSRIGQEPGDASKVANVIVDVVRQEGVMIGKTFDGSLFLGSDCRMDVQQRCNDVLKNLEEWAEVIASVDIDRERRYTD